MDLTKEAVHTAALEYLNGLLAKDRTAIVALMRRHVPCNTELVADKHVVVTDDDHVGPLGLFNGFLSYLGVKAVAIQTEFVKPQVDNGSVSAGLPNVEFVTYAPKIANSKT